MKKQKNKLTPAQRKEIIVLRLEKNWGLREIAEKFGVTTQNISYYLRKHKDKLQAEKKKAQKTPPAYELDPIKFRIQKLQEVALDILVAREEKVIHSSFQRSVQNVTLLTGIEKNKHLAPNSMKTLLHREGIFEGHTKPPEAIPRGLLF